MFDIEHLGKGAIPDPVDERDFIIGAIPPVDFSVPFILPEPLNEDQGISSSCVAQAWSYYHWQLENKDFTRRDIYAWVALPGGGANIRDGGLRIIKNGQMTRDKAADPDPETEMGMLDRTGLLAEMEALNKEFNSFSLPKDIDSIAAGIKNYKGVVFGVIGSNPGWQVMAQPRPPLASETLWGHCLYLFGYHLHNGKKCVIAKSSWGNTGNTTVHHITEDYFINNGAYIFNPWTLIKGDSMNLVNDNGTYYLVGELGKIGISDPVALAKFKAITAQETTGSTAAVPQKAVFKSESISVLVDN